VVAQPFALLKLTSLYEILGFQDGDVTKNCCFLGLGAVYQITGHHIRE
jgi:hypothetical protein